ncbi:hypothetical protein GGF31_004982 [Allomyces arbusculus]|nr:hypothetical protein GGF31_004982 [Allomyces arbusculus]
MVEFFSVNLIASSVAALAARMTTHPMDTVKTRIQADAGLRETPVGARTALLDIFRSEGLRGLYRGLPVALVFSVPAVSIYLYAYDETKRVLAAGVGPVQVAETSPVAHFTAAVLAEMLSGLFWTPLEMIKNRQQMGHGKTYIDAPLAVPRSRHPSMSSVGSSATAPLLETGVQRQSYSSLPRAASGDLSALAIARRIYQQRGIVGFQKGYWLSLCVFVPYSVTYFLSYEQLKSLYSTHVLDRPLTSDTKLPFSAYLMCAGVSGSLAASISNPLDRVRTIVQVSNKRPSAWTVIRQLAREEGWWKGATRGLVPRVVWVVPSVVISMTVYEMLKV